MSNFDRQVANALARIHRELFGGQAPPCRWYYSASQDIYHCPHTAIFGKDLMAQIPEWKEFNEPTLAQEQWDSSTEKDHPI